MRIENGTLILETCKCYCTDGKTRVGIRCKNDGRKQRGKPCELCGSKSKNHNMSYEYVTCSYCAGVGTRPETIYDYMPNSMWQSLNVVVKRLDAKLSPYERVLGAGVYSCVDYGRSWSTTDDALIAEVRASTGHQACKIVTQEGRLLTTICIVVRKDGYSVIAIPNE